MNKPLTPLEPDHYKLADKIKKRAYLSRDQKDAIAFFLGDAFKDEDKNFDYPNWLKACGS